MTEPNDFPDNFTPAKYKALQDRVEHLEKINRWNMNALQILIQMSGVNSNNGLVRDTKAIFSVTKDQLNQLIHFEFTAFFTVDEQDSSFILTDFSNESEKDNILDIRDALIDNGEFAWALTQNRTVETDHNDKDKIILLHVLTTKTRIRGMFMGITKKPMTLSMASQNLLSIILQNTAYSLESAELYKMLSNRNVELEKLVEERTQSLQKAVAEADKANQSKSQFLANMSHEIRTPMNAIINLSQLALQGELSTDQRDYIEKVFLSGQNLLQIINDILDFSKIEAGKLDIESTPFDLPQLITEIASILQLTAETKALALNFNLSPQIPTQLIGDGHRLRQILINLINNAIKFTHQGEVTVKVDVIASTDKLTEIQFSVTDTGIGISDEQMSRLFQPFSQADVSTTRKYGGTGLGLVICKQLIDNMNGEINVVSSLNKGSTFIFKLPFKISSITEKKITPTHDKEIINTESPVKKDVEILLVEDNEINQLIATRYLQQQGYKTLIAVHGIEALEKLNQQNVDLILMDLQMPEMDGYEATKKIRQQPKWADIPIIAMTADAMNDVNEKCLAAGMNDYISKPINVKQLNETLRRWLSRR